MAEADEAEEIDYYAVLNVRKEVKTIFVKSLTVKNCFSVNLVQRYYVSG